TSFSRRGSTLRVFDDGGNELWSTPIANRGSFAPQERTLLTTPDGLIASAAWTDNPMTVTGNMEVLTFDPDGANTVSSFGNRAVIGTSPGTFVFDGAASSSGAIALTGQFGG